MKTTLTIVGVVAIVFVVLVLLPREAPSAPYSLAHIDIADTDEERAQGLSGKEVPEDYGMLFVFPTEGQYGFWMKETLVPLDVIWLAGDGTILGITKEVSADTYPQAFYPPAPVRYVLEVLGGTSATRGWATSTVLSLPLPH